MAALRAVFGLLLVAGLLCFGIYVATGDQRWRVRGVFIVRWTVIAALGFFAVLIVERALEMMRG